MTGTSLGSAPGKASNPAETGGAGGLTQKIGAQNWETGQKAIIKTGWPGTSVKELTWSRRARVIGLLAARAQRYLTRRSSPSSLEVLIGLGDSTSADWLWIATTTEMQARMHRRHIGLPSEGFCHLD